MRTLLITMFLAPLPIIAMISQDVRAAACPVAISDFVRLGATDDGSGSRYSATLHGESRDLPGFEISLLDAKGKPLGSVPIQAARLTNPERVGDVLFWWTGPPVSAAAVRWPTTSAGAADLCAAETVTIGNYGDEVSATVYADALEPFSIAKPLGNINSYTEAAFKFKQVPIYPPFDYAMGHEGRTTVLATVEPNGIGDHLSIYRSSGYDSMDRAALSAAASSSYSPYLVNGRPVKQVYKLDYEFREPGRVSDDGCGVNIANAYYAPLAADANRSILTVKFSQGSTPFSAASMDVVLDDKGTGVVVAWQAASLAPPASQPGGTNSVHAISQDMSSGLSLLWTGPLIHFVAIHSVTIGSDKPTQCIPLRALVRWDGEPGAPPTASTMANVQPQSAYLVLTGKFERYIPPKYPISEMKSGTSGSASILVNVDEQGKPVHAYVAFAAGAKAFGEAAVAAAMASTFQITKINGAAQTFYQRGYTFSAERPDMPLPLTDVSTDATHKR